MHSDPCRMQSDRSSDARKFWKYWNGYSNMVHLSTEFVEKVIEIWWIKLECGTQFTCRDYSHSCFTIKHQHFFTREHMVEKRMEVLSIAQAQVWQCAYKFADHRPHGSTAAWWPKGNSVAGHQITLSGDWGTISLTPSHDRKVRLQAVPL